jgi:hypothetical protein
VRNQTVLSPKRYFLSRGGIATARDALGLVWFDIDQHQGIYHQDWRIENSPAAEAAFRLHASDLPLTQP